MPGISPSANGTTTRVLMAAQYAACPPSVPASPAHRPPTVQSSTAAAKLRRAAYGSPADSARVTVRNGSRAPCAGTLPVGLLARLPAGCPLLAWTVFYHLGGMVSYVATCFGSLVSPSPDPVSVVGPLGVEPGVGSRWVAFGLWVGRSPTMSIDGSALRWNWGGKAVPSAKKMPTACRRAPEPT